MCLNFDHAGEFHVGTTWWRSMGQRHSGVMLKKNRYIGVLANK